MISCNFQVIRLSDYVLAVIYYYFRYIFLDRRFPAQTKLETIKKVAVDQLLFAPPYLHGVLGFLSILEVSRGHSYLLIASVVTLIVARMNCFLIIFFQPHLRSANIDKNRTTLHIQSPRSPHSIVAVVITLTNVLHFMNTSSVNQGKDIREVKLRLREEGFKVVAAAWCYWPLSQVFNFYVIPLPYRFLYASSIAVCWNVYFSWRSNTSTPDIMLFPE